MAGHNKWSKIKRQKAINDAKKGKIFSKLSQLITHAARNGGGDVNMNPTLRLYVQQAKEEGFPVDSVQKAIDKGVGVDGSNQLVEATYEGFGPSGIAFLVDVLTDNTNRTVAQLRTLFEDIGGNLGEAGSVSWNFDVKGYINVKAGKMVKAEKFGAEDLFSQESIEDVMMILMDIDGVDDIEAEYDSTISIYCDFKNLTKVRDAIIALGYVVTKSQLVRLPKMYKKVTEEETEKVLNAIETLEENDDVQDVWTDLEMN